MTEPTQLSTRPEQIHIATKEVWDKAVPRPEATGDYGIVRFVSVPISTLLLNCSVSPDAATLLMLLIGLSGVGLIATAQYWLIALGAGLLILHEILDYVDGEMARYLDARSSAGHFLESVSHDVVYGLLPLAVGWVVFSTYEANPLFLILGGIPGLFGAINRNLRGKLAWSMANFSGALTDETVTRLNGGARANRENQSSLKKLIRQCRVRLFGYQELVFILLPVAVLTQRLDWFLIYYSAAFPLIYALKVLAMYLTARRDREAANSHDMSQAATH